MTVLEIPPEIWGKIFELCCNDGGQMGRSLALVSRYIHAASKPYRYRTVGLIGHTAIAKFAELMDTDPECRRVNHLFVSTFKPEKSILEYIQNSRLQGSIPPPPRVHDDNNGSEPNVKHEVIADMYRIFEAIAPSLETLHVVMGFYRNDTFFPIVFPSLVELAIQGPFHDHEDCSDEFCDDTLCPTTPSLRRLYLAEVFTGANDRTYQTIKHYAPYLTHLRIQCTDGYIESSKPFLRQLMQGGEKGEGSSGDNEEERGGDGDRRPQFPETLERVLLHPGPGLPPGRCGTGYMMRFMAIRELGRVVDKDPRVVLLKESRWMWPYLTTHSYIEGRRHWLDRIAGGDGCWSI